MPVNQFSLKTKIKQHVSLTYGDGFVARKDGHSVVDDACASSPTEEPPITVGVEEACRLLSIGRTSFYRIMDAGEVAFFHRGRRRLIVRQSLIEYVRRQTSEKG